MSNERVAGFLVDVSDPDNRSFGKAVWNHKDDWRSIYGMLHCTTFTIATRRFGKYTFDIYLDDEGMLKNDNVVSAISLDKNELLVGNLFIVSHNDDGEVVSLTDDEIRYLNLHVVAGLLRYSL